MADKLEEINDVTTKNSIMNDLEEILEKMNGPSRELLEEMIASAERNPDNQTRAIERLLREKIHSIDETIEGVEE